MPSIKALLGESMIISALSSAADKITDAAKDSAVGSYLTSYEGLCRKRDESAGAVIWDNIYRRGGFLRGLKRGVIRSFENSRILGFISRKLCGLLGCSLRYYGVMLLSFSIYALAIFGVRSYIDGAPDFSRMAVGFICAAMSIFLLISDTPLSKALCGSFIMSALLFKVIGIRREYIETAQPVQGRTLAAFLIGMALGLVSYFVSPALILLSVAALLVLYIILVIPEAGVLGLLFVAPFLGILPHPSLISAGMTLYVAVCYLLKLIRGKRTVKFEPLDGAVALFGIMLLLGGVFTVSVSASLSYALIYFSLMLSYFLTVNLIRTPEWIGRCVIALVSSSTIVALYGIYQNFLGTASVKWQDTEMFEGMSGRVTSFFENPNVLAEYLIMTLPFALALLLLAKKGGTRLFTLALCAAGALCLVYTMSRGAWLGCMLAILIFFLIYSRKTIIVCLLGLVSLPVIPFIMPDAIIKRFTSIGNISDSSTAYRVHIWEGCMDMLKDFLWGGIGVGKDAFAIVYPSYTLAGIESAPHAHNLYLQIAIELGIFGLLTFLFMAVLFARSGFSFFNDSASAAVNDRGAAKLRLFGAAGFCGIIAVAAQGMTDYIWYNYRIFLMFWLLIGFTAAVRRTYNRYAAG